MDDLAVLVIGLLAFSASWIKGVRWAFFWIYLPVLLLVPQVIRCDIAGLPDLNCQAAACVALIPRALIDPEKRPVPFRWRWFDLLALAPVISFAISYGMNTGFAGFGHRVVVLALEWGCPYFLARLLIRDFDDARLALLPLAISAVVLAGLAVWECRMATRLAPKLWNMAGFEVPVPPHRSSWRWGFLRAAASLSHPIVLGTCFAALTPLMVLWAFIAPKWRWWAGGAAAACAAGCFASLSRGPILVLVAALALLWIGSVPRKSVLLIAICVVVAASPFLLDLATEEVQYTESRLVTTGNTAGESGHYRMALLLIYGKRVLDVGWLGDRSLVALEYEKAWSVDNAYLYLFLLGGWVGGGAICLMVIGLLLFGGRGVLRSQGPERKPRAALVASFAAITACMGNVWFAPDYASLFWIIAAMVLNLVCSPQSVPVPASPRQARVHAPSPESGLLVQRTASRMARTE